MYSAEAANLTPPERQPDVAQKTASVDVYLRRINARGKVGSAGGSLFEPAEWKSVYRVVEQKSPPREPPTLAAMVRMVAQLGGYVNRPRKDPPGPQTVWLGLQRMHDFALCWQLFGPDAEKEP